MVELIPRFSRVFLAAFWPSIRPRSCSPSSVCNRLIVSEPSTRSQIGSIAPTSILSVFVTVFGACLIESFHFSSAVVSVIFLDNSTRSYFPNTRLYPYPEAISSALSTYLCSPSRIFNKTPRLTVLPSGSILSPISLR